MQRRLAAIVVADMVGYGCLMAADESGTITRAEAMKPRVIPIMSSRKVLEVKPIQSAA